MKNQTSNTFSTDNFQLASYLLSESCPLLMLDKANPKRAVFIFDESERRQQLTSQFLEYKASVEPHRLFSAMRDLKQMLYSNTT